MILITGFTLTCLIISTRSQNFYPQNNNQYYSQYQNQNPDNIYFPDNRVSQSQAQPTPDPNVLKQIFGEPTRTSTAVEVEKSNEITVGNNSPFEQVTNRVPTPSLSPNRQVVQASVVRPAVEQASVPNREGYNNLLYSVTNFGIQLFKRIVLGNAGNVVMSPYSITTLLALLQQGAQGQTAMQLATALQMNPAASADVYSQITSDFKNRRSRNILKTANNVFIGDGFTINRDFKHVAQSKFDSDITTVPFERTDIAANRINQWVASKTENNIQNLVSAGSFSPSTQVVLLNAVYFKGLWELPFRVESTVPREFQLSNGQIKVTQFMRKQMALKTGVDHTTNARVVVLPFENKQYTFMVILPSVLEGIFGTLNSLTDARLLSYLSFGQQEIELEIPKFTIKCDTDLEPVLKDLGIKNIFGGAAELSGLGHYRTFSPQISSALHSAVLSIDEQGGTASAATSFAAVALSFDGPYTLVKINRPFIVVLWDSVTSLPIFMAKIEDPTR